MRNSLLNANQWKSSCMMLFMLVLFGSINSLNAQTVSGVVSDSKGLTLPGVSVTVKNSQVGATTDIDGKFTVLAASNATLVVSFIGFATQEIAVNDRKTIKITMADNMENLEEVVVIGYGTQKKSDVNGSVSSVKAKDIADIPQVSFDQMLQGKAAGVTVTNNSGQPGSAVSVKIRGASSLTGSNEPLYVIDGIPISGDATNRSTHGTPIAGSNFSNQGSNAVSPLSMINPNDIESMDILKDASATAIYGSRGANGVVIITTKSGKKGTGRITYDTFLSIQEQAKLLKTMNLQEYATLQNAIALEYNQVPRVEFAHPELLGSGTNWQKEIYKSAVLKNHQLAFSGGKEGVTYYLSGSYTDQEGTIIGSGFKRYTFKTNVDAKLKEWFKVGVNISASITNEDLTLNGQSNGIVSTSLLAAPDVPVRNLDGTFAGPPVNDSNISFTNPVAIALSKTNELVRKNFLGNFYAEAKLFKGLEYRFELGANTEFSENTEFLPTYEWGVASNRNAVLNTRKQDWYSVNIKNLLTYRANFGKSGITILAGQEANETRWKGTALEARGFLSNDIKTISVAEASQVMPTSDYLGSNSLYSYFGRIIYDFDNKYSVTASMRADGSSKFADGKKWGYFPAASASWKLSNESFMQSTKDYVDNIRLKIGYGETGNQQIPNYRYGVVLNTLQTGIGNAFLASNYANKNLQWEESKQTNLGIDFTLFDSRFGATVEVYKKESKKFLYQLPLSLMLTGGDSYYGGISAPYSNIGVMQNKGIDITLTYATKPGNAFSWNSTLVVSKYKNEVTEIRDGLSLQKDILLNDFTSVPVTNTVVGQPMGQFYGHQYEGIFRTQQDLDSNSVTYYGNQPQLGDAIYQDLNGDGNIDEKDLKFIGNPHPDFTYGFTNNFSYKGIDLSIFLQGSQGNDILNLTRRAGTLNANLYTNQLAEAIDFYSPTNTDASLPRPTNALSHPNNKISNRYVEDGSYLRIQNVTLGYSIPTDVISKMKLTRLRIYAGVQNLYTFTNYSGYDPEVGSFNQDALFMNIDNGRYPTPRTFTMGMNVEF